MTQKGKIFVWALLLQVLLTGSAKADKYSDDKADMLSASQLINQMSEASRTLNYIGVFMYRRGGQVDTMKLIHRYSEFGEQERLVSLSGNAREVIRDNDSVTCIFPENEKVMVEKAKPRDFFKSTLPEPIEKIEPFYQFQIASSDRIAGKNTWVVNIVPKDQYRYGYQLWIDQDSKLMLRSDVKTLNGEILEQIIFADINIFNDIAESNLMPEISGAEYSWQNRKYDPIEDIPHDSKWHIGWLPKGFVLTEQENKMLMNSKTPVNHLAYSDGLSTVSVFIEKQSKKSEVRYGASTMGGLNAFAVAADDYQMTVVGEVPMSTVEKMAKSIQAQ